MMSERRLAVLVLLASVAVACGGGGNGGDGDGDGDSFDRGTLLANLADNVLLPVVTSLETSADDLTADINAYCSAIDTGTEASTLAAARDGWREAMLSVQRAEIMQLGPSAANDGQLRDELYSWPLSSSCAVDQEVKSYFDDPPSYNISGRLTNRRGMDALEYVLFATSLEHTCTGPVAPPGWDSLSDLERKRARCGYAAAAAVDVARVATALADGWRADGGNFLGELKSAGEAGSSFASQQVALNVISDAMFFLDFEVKDIKLGESAGISENSCGVIGEGCAEELESQFANHSKANIVANLRAFELLFTGGDGVGFDDMLTGLGAASLAATMTADVAAMIAAAEAIPEPLRSALESDYSTVTASHAAVKVVTDNMKSQFLTVLGLDIPDSAAGDND